MEDSVINTLEQMQAAGHEQVSFFCDEQTGLKAIIAIHSTRLGPALGGCRVWPYESESAALNDVLRLSRAMTYKNSAMGLPLGGGKSVIIADSGVDKTPELFEAFGRAVDSLGGRYITAQDVGSEPEDMKAIRRQTRFVAGLPDSSGDPSPATAFGIYSGIKATMAHLHGSGELAGKRVAVQGLGAVGMSLCEFLHRDGVELIVTDIAQKRMDYAVRELGAQAVTSDQIFDVTADVFAPCALGAVLNDSTIPRLKVRVVAGSANNQLAEPRHAISLKDKAILYAPDFIINGGGVINVAAELEPGGYHRERAYGRIGGIGEMLTRTYELAESRGISTDAAAMIMAEERLQAAA